MSSKKKPKRNNFGNKLSLGELAIDLVSNQERKGNSHPRWKSTPLEEPDVSRILKVAGANQLEELGDSFDHPLHSTAVDAYGEEHSHKSLNHAPVEQRKSTEKSKKKHLSKTSHGDVQKSSTADPEDESFKENGKALNKTGFQAGKKRPSEEDTSDPSVDSLCSVQIWCPKTMKRSSKDITELDAILAEFEKITANYIQSIESKVSRQAVSGFCSAFKDQITDLIVEIQELKNMKKKNAKIRADIKKKRQQLLQVREELIGAEQQQIKLKREYAEMQERKSSLRQATELLTDLKELQEGCLCYEEENPKEKMVYGTSSLPALLVESKRILGAERHFHNINKKLQEALAVQRGKLLEKH